MLIVVLTVLTAVLIVVLTVLTAVLIVVLTAVLIVVLTGSKIKFFRARNPSNRPGTWGDGAASSQPRVCHTRLGRVSRLVRTATRSRDGGSGGRVGEGWRVSQPFVGKGDRCI